MSDQLLWLEHYYSNDAENNLPGFIVSSPLSSFCTYAKKERDREQKHSSLHHLRMIKITVCVVCSMSLTIHMYNHEQ